MLTSLAPSPRLMRKQQSITSSSGLGAHGFTRIVYGFKILKRRFGMSDNKQASTVEAQRGIVRPHQPGQDVFRSILPEEIDWKPFRSFPPSVRRAALGGRAVHHQGQSAARREADASPPPGGSSLHSYFRRFLHRHGRSFRR